VRLMEPLDTEALLLLPVQFPVPRGAKLPAGDFSVER
jgi:hypothetical protein